ncbi:MAG TPA: glycosyl hydrolase family 17 protein [Xanthobacteraceae bacterium]|jgi:glucan 1,3-beta-glucosidase|nr:glycosyl hydrolase family 17 protein [Xanthobacteraceae bacterium]
MRVGFAYFAGVVSAVIAAWWWLGAGVTMPPSPLKDGEKLYCVSYTPFRGLETPLDRSTRADPKRIDEDFSRLSRLTNCVRTYSTDLGLDQVAEIAGRHGLKVIQGLWLGREADRNRREIEMAIDLAKRYPNVIQSIVVGNEVLLRGEMSAMDLAGIIKQVKARVSVPVTYADVWEFWLRNRELYDAVDFVTIHILPYWEDFPIAARDAAAHIASIRRMVATRFPDKEILIGETGWPSAGRMREGALPSPANQAHVIHELLAIAKAEKFNVNVIEAFDQPWKRQLEGTVGGHWGFLDGDAREFKFQWGEPVSNHPRWRQQAAIGVALAAFVFAAAAASVGRLKKSPDEPVHRLWIAVAFIALISGSLTGLAIEAVPLESLGIGGWSTNLALIVLAVLSPVICSIALMRRVSIPAFANVLGRRAERSFDPLVMTLGMLFVALTIAAVALALGLLFDPRYRDFPFAAMTAATVPFLVLAWLSSRLEMRSFISEKVSAATLMIAVAYIVPNESFANWQALWLCGAFAALPIALLRSSRKPAATAHRNQI